MKQVLLLLFAAAFGDSQISSEKLAALMKDSKPLVIQVGFNVLYRSAHIAGTVYAGPGSKPEGIDELKALVAKEPRDREIILYCGCCPWEKCPTYGLLTPRCMRLASPAYPLCTFRKISRRTGSTKACRLTSGPRIDHGPGSDSNARREEARRK